MVRDHEIAGGAVRQVQRGLDDKEVLVAERTLADATAIDEWDGRAGSRLPCCVDLLAQRGTELRKIPESGTSSSASLDSLGAAI